MLKRRALALIGAALVLAGCGSQTAEPTGPGGLGASSSSPEPTSATPSISPPATASVVGSMPVPSDAPTAAPTVESLLDSLLAPGDHVSTMRGPSSKNSKPVADWLTVRPCSEVYEWLGNPAVTIPSLTTGKYTTACVTDYSKSLPRDGKNIDPDTKEDLGVTAYVVYLPTGNTLKKSTFEEILKAGGGYTQIYWGPKTWQWGDTAPPPQPENPAGGSATVALPGTTELIGVQNVGSATRVSSLYKSPDGRKYNVVDFLPLEPAAAYRLVASKHA